MSPPEVGVLLPVRLETRFVDHGRMGWALRVRVVPDAVSITNRDPNPSAFELDAVETMWQQAGSANLESARGRAAWRTLARLVGAETAAYLARTFPPVRRPNGDLTIKRPRTVRTVMNAPRLHGLTPTMELWLARAGQPAQVAATLRPLVSQIDLDLDDPDSSKQPWWASFAEAVRVGMAAEIELGLGFPGDIDTLYVVGIGGGDPGSLLEAQADSGRLGVIAPGTPTNSIDGAPAASFGDDDTWRRLVKVRASGQAGTRAVGLALAAPSSLAGVVGGEDDHRGLNTDLVRALWPALWGHGLANVWGQGSRTDQLGVWAAQNLVPEGPLPSIRVDDQPYGLLPVTSLRRWKADDGDPSVEAELVPVIRALVASWAETSEAAHAATVDQLDQVARGPHATTYAWRWMLPTDLTTAVSFRYAAPVDRGRLDGWWDRQAPQARLSPGAAPARRLVATGWAQEVEIDLAPDDADDDLAGSLTALGTATLPELIEAGPSGPGEPGSAPWSRTLLTELGRHSLIASAATVARNVAGQPRALVEPLSRDSRAASETEVWATRLQPGDLRRSADPAVTVHDNVRAGLAALAGHRSSHVERALRALVDTAADRIDPWATAVAWRRLQALAAAPRTLGVYGWVDAPRPRPVAPDHRFVLAPSREQANVAAMLRDRALHDPDASAWAADLTSDAVRDALRIAGEVRQGSHPAETLGRMAERIVVRPDVVASLREEFPLTAAFGIGPGPRQIRVRRVCNGVAVLDAARSDPTRLSNLGVRPRQLVSLVALSEAVDALADLHLVEGALGVVQHRPALVSSSSAAAAGEAPPPRFTFADTPRTGMAVDSVVVVVLPDARRLTGVNASPAAIADPAVAAHLDERAGPADGPLWTWRILDARGRRVGTVTLDDIGLRPCDTVGLAPGNLRDTLVAASGADALARSDPGGPQLVRTLAAAIAGRPASASDVGPAPDDGGAAVTDLAARYAALHNAAVAAVAAARPAAGSGDTARARRQLARLARWGISPLSADASGGTPLADRLTGAADVLERRLTALPPTLAGATVDELVTSLTALVCPEAGYPIFARLPVAAFRGARGEPSRAGQALRLDPDWLEVVSAVRPSMARLEAAQLGERARRRGGRPLRTWSNHPGDPWQTGLAAPRSTARSSRLIALFGTPGVLPARPTATSPGRVAAAIVDRFAEQVPDREHVAAVAFPHDLPTARAPQAVLLAVPPLVDEALSTAVLVDIVAEARDLARARMTTAAQVGPTGALLHAAAFPAAGRAAVHLGGG